MPPKRRPSPRTFNDPAKAAAYARQLARELGAQVEAPARGPAPQSPSPPHEPAEDFRAAQWDADIAAEEERQERLATTVFTDLKDPTNTEFPHRPRSNYAEYDPVSQILRIWWARPGRLGPYTNYYDVTPQEFREVEITSSTGKYVNRVLNYKNYDYE
jgi:hypothetical protein